MFARARENARRASCQSNLKQLGLGFQQYTQDYDEKLPNAGSVDWYHGWGWANQIYTYVKSDQIFKCPSDVTRYSAGHLPISYAYNRNYVKTNTGLPAAIALSELEGPAKTINAFEVGDVRANISCCNRGVQSLSKSIVEYSGSWGNNPGDGSPSGNGPRPGDGGGLNVAVYATGPMGGHATGDRLADGGFTYGQGIHMDGSNYLFADGHVKWLKGAAVSPGNNANNATDAQAAPRAAGTGHGQFTGTFSVK